MDGGEPPSGGGIDAAGPPAELFCARGILDPDMEECTPGTCTDPDPIGNYTRH